MLDDETAKQFITNENILWYQCFNLAPNVTTPGVSGSLEWTLDRLGLPDRLDGLSVLDIGTTNGGVAFIAEERGAARVVAADLYEPEWFGFDRIKKVLGSRVEFVRGSIYELPNLLNEEFDIIFFLGILYHLRHPLLAIDCLHDLSRGLIYVETAVGGEVDDPPVANFYRRDEMAGDNSNWFVPTMSCAVDWIASSGFVIDRSDCWPDERPTRGLVVAHREEGDPEYMRISYESPLSATIRRLP